MTDLPEVSSLSYEQARDELVVIVSKLEAGQAPLEQSLALWERGEALAAHCRAWLDGAQSRIAGAAPGERPAAGDDEAPDVPVVGYVADVDDV